MYVCYALLRGAGQAYEEVYYREIKKLAAIRLDWLAHTVIDKLTRQGITEHVDGLQAADAMRSIIKLHT